MTADGNHTYFYDAENRLAQVDGTFGTCSTAAACYVYDAFGRRVQKTTPGLNPMNYLYDLGGHAVSEVAIAPGTWNPANPSIGWHAGYIYAGNQLLAEYRNNTTYFVHSDHLGSTRLVTDLNKNVVQSLDYLPFGELNSTDSGISTHKFTGDEHDAETSFDHTQFRQYTSSLARWITPDLFLGSLDNPQSLNRYAYVLNDPLAFTDPLGLFTKVPDGCTVTYPVPGGPGQINCYSENFCDLIGTGFGSFDPTGTYWVQVCAAPARANEHREHYGRGGGRGRKPPTMKGVPKNCSLSARIFNSTTFNFKEGLDVEAGVFSAGLSQNVNFETNATTVEAELGLFGSGFNAQRVTDTGYLNPDLVNPNTEFSGHLGPIEHVFGGETQLSTSKLIKLGFALGGGLDFSFDLNKFKELTASCKQP